MFKKVIYLIYKYKNQTILNSLDKCIECGLCMKNCPFMSDFFENPKKLKDILKKPISLKMSFLCNDCKFCNYICPKNINICEIFYSIKTEINEEFGRVPKEIEKNKAYTFEKMSNNLLFSNNIKENLNVDSIIFFPGCSLSSKRPDLTILCYEFLKKNFNEPVLIWQKCCNKPLKSLGDIKSSNEYTSSLISDFKKLKAKKIFVACLNCYEMLKKNIDFAEVSSIFPFIDEHICTSNLKQKLTFTIHDPCPSRDNTLIQNSIRSICKKLNLNIIESEFSREKTLCCGSGGMMNIIDSAYQEKAKLIRKNTLKNYPIITYCQECVSSLESLSSCNHILDFVFNKKSLKRVNWLKSWSNRAICKNEAAKILKELKKEIL